MTKRNAVPHIIASVIAALVTSATRPALGNHMSVGPYIGAFVTTLFYFFCTLVLQIMEPDYQLGLEFALLGLMAGIASDSVASPLLPKIFAPLQSNSTLGL
jgi:hypothetical protein